MRPILHLFFSCLLAINVASAQYSRLLDFNADSTGRNPYGTLLLHNGYLYGTTGSGGSLSMGTLFRLLPDGTGFEKLLDFTGSANGRTPLGALISDGTYLYGVASRGGTFDRGSMFRFLPDGTGFQKIYDFPGDSVGLEPTGDLVTDSSYIYGTTDRGGNNYHGTIFRIQMNGTGHQKLHDFENATTGQNPLGKLFTDGTYLYGMTDRGGANDMGIVYKIGKDGTGFTTLLHYNGVANGSQGKGGFVSDGTFLYGMTHAGGANDNGTIFKIMPDGTGYQKLMEFNGPVNGRAPRGSLLLANGSLYGMTEDGGTHDEGVLFKIGTDGNGFQKLLIFHQDTTGEMPQASLIYDGTFFYGTTYGGGSENDGVVFRFMETNSTSLGVSSAQQFTIIPHPISSYAELKTQAPLDDATLMIINARGQVVKQYCNLQGSAVTIFREELPAGIYTFCITQHNRKAFSGKIVLQ